MSEEATILQQFESRQYDQPLKDRPLSAVEIERMRLALSIFRDGSGQFIRSIGEFMPDYLDYERVTALICGGETAENKGVFDVIVPSFDGLPFGISCKMSTSQRNDHDASFMELSNSQKKFNDEFERRDINWATQPELAGPAVVDLVTSWHADRADDIDLESSRYLVLSHDRRWQYFQLHCYSMDLKIAHPESDIIWVNEGSSERAWPSSVAGYIEHKRRRHRLWQLFQRSGGQLKFFPPLDWAEWVSDIFTLELPPTRSIEDRVREYFPGRWP